MRSRSRRASRGYDTTEQHRLMPYRHGLLGSVPTHLMVFMALVWGSTRAAAEMPLGADEVEPSFTATDAVSSSVRPYVLASLELKITEPSLRGVYRLAFSPNERYVAARDREQRIHVCRTNSGRSWAVFHKHESAINTLVFSPDSRVLVSAADDAPGSLVLWDVESRVLRRQIGLPASFARFTSERQLLVVTPNDLRQIDVQSGIETNAVENLIPNQALPIAISHSGRQLVLYRPNRADTQQFPLVLYAIDDSASPNSFYVPFAPRMVQFSPDDRLLAVSGQRSSDIFLAETQSPENFVLLQGIAEPVQQIAFSPDGRFLIAGGFDGAVQIWELLTRRLVARHELYRDHINALAISETSRMLATGVAGE
ncbi:MAG: hypothetical protein KDA60_10940, partial [Planctomycetales bacterium]|nr:hypothetical protein [Planctomycetales bacterium]